MKTIWKLNHLARMKSQNDNCFIHKNLYLSLFINLKFYLRFMKQIKFNFDVEIINIEHLNI